jgi:hypothetical protein
LIATSVFSTVYLHQFPVNNSLLEMIVYDFLQSSISFFLVVWRSRFLTTYQADPIQRLHYKALNINKKNLTTPKR